MKIQVLDHGYVEFVEAWGRGKSCGLTVDVAELTDEQKAQRSSPTVTVSYPEDADYECGIIEAARQSTQGSFRGWEQDAKLLKYLHDHKHATPFEFAGMVLEVQAPIFVFREWHRHRTQSYNEMSARYSPLPDLYYVPESVPMRMCQVSNNKQAGGTREGNLTVEEVTRRAEIWSQKLNHIYQECELLYQDGLQAGIPKELARLVMPVGHYSKMRASANLRNWLAFLTLRMDPAAQLEIRQYANAVAECVQQTFPQTWKLFTSAL